MVCSAFSAVATFNDLLVWPTGCFYYFWLVILGAIFLILTIGFYQREKEEKLTADAISSLGVSSVIVDFLALLLTLVKNTDGIPALQSDLFLYVFAFSIPFILIWFFKKN